MARSATIVVSLILSLAISTATHAQGVSGSSTAGSIANLGGAAANLTQAAHLKTKCTLSTVGGAFWCTVAALGVGAAGAQIYTAMGYRNQCKQVNGGNACVSSPTPFGYVPPPGGGGGGGTGGTDGGDDDGGGGGTGSGGSGGMTDKKFFSEIKRLQQEADRIKKQLAEKGYAIDGQGNLKTPRGTATPGQMMSGAGMAQAGLIDPNQAEAYDKALAEQAEKQKAAEKAAVAQMLNSVGGGGGGFSGYGSGSRSAASVGTEAFAMSSSFNFGGSGEEGPRPAQTAGLVKSFGKDPIGTATDSVFEMVHRRYRALDSKNEFIRAP
jgi:hypothetical protein